MRGVPSRNLRRLCGRWPRGEVPDDYKEPVRSDVPVLMISGETDPVTPPRLAEAALEHLANGRHMVVPDGGHAPLTPGCVGRLMHEFIDTGTVRGLNTDCVDKMDGRTFDLDR